MGRQKTVNENLPPRMICRIKKGMNYYAYCTKGTNRKEIALGSNFDLAMNKYKILIAMDKLVSPDNLCPNDYEKHLYRRSKKNAKIRGIYFDITEEEIGFLLKRNDYKCEVTNINFDMSKSDYAMRPWIPSLDRINSKKGYTIDNCRVICCAVNLALNQFGDEVLVRIAQSMFRNGKIKI